MTAPAEPATVLAPRRRSCWVALGRALVAALAVTAILGCAGWFARAPLLHSLATAWVVSDPVGPADAAAVLGGGLEDRPFAAAEYYREGLVKKIIVTNVPEGPAEQLGVSPTQTALNTAMLVKLGVPAQAIVTIGNGLRNTHQEALALRGWALRSGARSLIVPTDVFAARRTRWILRRVFGGDGIKIRVPALVPPEYRHHAWWLSKSGLLRFQNEVLKYVYYRLEY
jgi:uncharacterized SAM-binding protein YcdF (DUF218 family)